MEIRWLSPALISRSKLWSKKLIIFITKFNQIMDTTWILDPLCLSYCSQFSTKSPNVFHSIVHVSKVCQKLWIGIVVKRNKRKLANEFSHIFLLHNFLLDSQRRNVKEDLFSCYFCTAELLNVHHWLQGRSISVWVWTEEIYFEMGDGNSLSLKDSVWLNKL